MSTSHLVLTIACVAIALAFEFVNGFHDTANAVATVIYTNTLPARLAVVLSGICNFLGVFAGGIAVAMGIVKLLPVELLVSSSTGAGLAMVLALLLAAIAWNLGTWYLGLPASSSHTLIGAILGVGLANGVISGRGLGEGVNWSKAQEMGVSLLVSPVVGFTAAALLLLIVQRYTRNQALLRPPPRDRPPPPGTRALLIATCCGVSFSHGSNDGQKGVGIIMLVLMGLVPATYALNRTQDPAVLRTTLAAATALDEVIASHGDAAARTNVDAVRDALARLRKALAGRTTAADVPESERFAVRQSILLADRGIESLIAAGGLGLTPQEKKSLDGKRKELRRLTEYAPTWVLLAVALSLGIGTMVGWRRIVITIGEKIGKAHLTYAQGAAAELVAASTIGLSSVVGLPVSTTHVLSSGIAGTMVAAGSGVQKSTVRSIALAWVLTLPASMLLSAGLFALFRALLGG